MEAITIPKAKMGRPTKQDRELFDLELKLFCEGIKEVRSTLDFHVSSRGWCYLLEEYGLNKGDFDRAQKLINDCRKSGLLPLDICAEDSSRTAEGIFHYYRSSDIDTEAESTKNYIEQTDFVGDYIRGVIDNYDPYHFMDFQDYYIEVLVEKIDLKGIFRPICNKYNVPYANSRGWADINSRAALMRRFRQWQDRGKQCVLLYCGDHDPGGLIISDTIMTNLNDLSPAVGFDPGGLIIERFGLNYEFIEDNNLTWIENLETGKKTGINRLDDPRHSDHNKEYVQSYIKQFGARKVEANALVTRVDAGRKLCEDAILKYYNTDGLEMYEQRTDQARTELYDRLNDELYN